MNLCQFKNMLGKPGEGVHSIRIANIAIVDVILTIIGAWILGKLFNVKFWIMLIILFLSSIIIHRIFCVRTTIDKLFFPKY